MSNTADTMTGRVVLVAGGTSGMGLSAVKSLAAAGARVVLTGKTEDEVAAALELCATENVQGLVADAIEPSAAVAAVEFAVKAFGRLDALFHVAGGSGRRFGDGPLHELTDEGWHRTLHWNLTSVMLSNRAALRRFLEQQSGGVILNMASVLGWASAPPHFSTHAYAAAKAGVIGFSRSLAAHYAVENIRVNVLAPGLVETPMAARALSDDTILDFIRHQQPLDGGRPARPDDIDGAVLFLLSDAARFITGQVLAVDGGWTSGAGG